MGPQQFVSESMSSYPASRPGRMSSTSGSAPIRVVTDHVSDDPTTTSAEVARGRAYPANPEPAGSPPKAQAVPPDPPPPTEIAPRVPAQPKPPGAPEVSVLAAPLVERGEVLRPETPVFRLRGSVSPGEQLAVRYTLAAFDARGSAAFDGSVLLSAEPRPVTIVAGAAVASRTPELLTLTLREQPGVRSARPTATLFLSPVPRIADATLFEAHRVGRSIEAFNVLVQRHWAAVAGVAVRVVGNRTDAEDIRQLVFAGLARYRGDFAGGSLVAWLRTVTRNASLSFVRGKHRRRKHELASAKPESFEPELVRGLGETLLAAVRQLPAELGEALRLRYLEGYSQQEAAEIAGCPRGTLSRRAVAGARRLREMFGDEDPRLG